MGRIINYITLTNLSRFLTDLKNWLPFTKGSGTKSMVSGNNSSVKATGNYSRAFGYSSANSSSDGIIASGGGSFAAGYADNGMISASGNGAHAEGYASDSYGDTTASGNGSHAEGVGTTAQNLGEHAEGICNISNKKTTGTKAEQQAGTTQHSVGIGEHNANKNAFEIMQNGDAYLYGVGGYNGTNPLGSQSVQQIISNSISFTNPVGPWRPDPCFWKGDDGYFYIKGTGRLNTVVRTRNFVNFEDTGRVFIPTEAQNEVFETYGHYATDDSTYKLHPNYWAPFVIKIGSNWVMYVAIVERTGTKSEPVDGAAHIVAFTSKTPYGDFENPVTIVSDGDFKITNSVVWNNVIDPFVYYDSKVNKLYLVAGSSYSIGCVELAEDGLSTVLQKGVGNKATRLGGLTINSDPNRWAVYEGAYVYVRPYNGQTYYYLFASMGDWATRDYAVVVGRSLSSNDGSYVDKSGINLITGNKSMSLARRILSTESDTSTFWGPGHIGGIFETEDGKTWMLYHCHDGSGEQDRKLFIQELLWDANGWPYFDNNGHPVESGAISKGVITDTPHIISKETGPLIIEGIYDTDLEAFVPNQGQPRFAEAVAAINSGRQVFLRFNWDESEPEAIADYLVTVVRESALAVWDFLNDRIVSMYDE